MKINFKGLRNGFLKSLTILAAGSLIAQMMVAVEQIFLARIFSPEALGMYSFLMSLPIAFSGVICGRYDLTIVYENEDKNVFPLVKLNLVINLTLTTIICVGYGLYLFFFKPEYNQFLWLLPAIFVYLFSFGLTNTLNAYNNRQRQYKMITKMHMGRTFCQCIGTVLLGLLVVIVLNQDSVAVSVPLLVIPYCVGMFGGVLTQAKALLEHRKEILGVSVRELWGVAKKHKKQPLFSAPAIFANGFSYSLITMSIDGLYNEAVTGYYSISTKLLGMPISLISGNISKVFMEEAAREYNATGKFKKAFNRTFLFLLTLAVPMFLCMYFLAPLACAFLFGGDWIVAGDYIRILAMMFAFRFVTTALSPGLYVCRKQVTELVIQVAFMLVTGLAAIIAVASQFSIESFLWAISIARSVVMAVLTLAVFYYSRGGAQKKEQAISVDNNDL